MVNDLKRHLLVGVLTFSQSQIGFSAEKGAEVAHAVASELVSLDRDENLMVHQILHGSATGRLLVSAQLPTKLPLPA